MTAIWNNALDRLSERLTPQTFNMLLRPVECRAIQGERILLRAPNEWIRHIFESNYLPLVLEDLRRTQGSNFQVEFDISETSPSPETEDSQAPEEPKRKEQIQVEPGVCPGPVSACPGLNPRYTFDTFVAGPSNQLAHAAARAVASPDPPNYNPLFICGGVGLGKTHLLHAIGNEILRIRGRVRISYLSGERFMTEYVHCIRTGTMHDFRQRYRPCEVLLLDDIQFIANGSSTQDEFFHTFNALYERQRQIVLSADRKPHEIPDIADRLRTRFAWGLMADIEPPELEVRIAILRKKAEAEGITLPDDVCLYIASAIKSNIRELEGALIRLTAYSSLSRREITLDYARETLEQSLVRPSEHLSVEMVLKTVAGYYQVKLPELKSERRQKSIAHPRAVAMFLARKFTGESYPDLGRAFGNKHHTTVLSAFEKISARLKDDAGLRGEIAAMEAQLQR